MNDFLEEEFEQEQDYKNFSLYEEVEEDNECWVRVCTVAGYEDVEDYYLFSNYGEIISNIYKKVNYLKTRADNNGYASISLKTVDGKDRLVRPHRLVGLTFVDKYESHYTILNHIDENKMNANYDNLEWCDQKYNVNYGTAKKRSRETMLKNKKKVKAVIAFNLETNEKTYFETIGDASRATLVGRSAISNICKGKQKSSKGYSFKYQEENGEK